MSQVHGTVFIFGGLALLGIAWGLCGLLKPKLVLWWAVPEKQTKARALGFALALAFAFLFYALAWLPDSAGWLWGPVLACTFLFVTMAGSFRKTEAEHREQLEERERAKKARVTHTVFSLTSDKTYEIHPYLSICSCPDWESRRVDAEGPFAVCKHLASHYADHQNEIPSNLIPYQKLLCYFGYEGKGIPPQGVIYGYGSIDGMAYLFTGYHDSLPWVNVYTEISGTERYGFNIETRRWARGEEPVHAEVLAEKIRLES